MSKIKIVAQDGVGHLYVPHRHTVIAFGKELMLMDIEGSRLLLGVYEAFEVATYVVKTFLSNLDFEFRVPTNEEAVIGYIRYLREERKKNATVEKEQEKQIDQFPLSVFLDELKQRILYNLEFYTGIKNSKDYDEYETLSKRDFLIRIKMLQELVADIENSIAK